MIVESDWRYDRLIFDLLVRLEYLGKGLTVAFFVDDVVLISVNNTDRDNC